MQGSKDADGLEDGLEDDFGAAGVRGVEGSFGGAGAAGEDGPDVLCQRCFSLRHYGWA